MQNTPTRKPKLTGHSSSVRIAHISWHMMLHQNLFRSERSLLFFTILRPRHFTGGRVCK